MTSNESPRWVSEQTDFSVNKVFENMSLFNELVPKAYSEEQIYDSEGNIDWTASFWVGMLFLSKELTNSTKFDEQIKVQMNSFQERLDKKIELDTHDIGFLYILSAVADYKINNNESSKIMMIKAADLLMERYSTRAEIIQAWGDLEDQSQSGRMIIDCLMNIPLLYFVSNITNNKKYYEAAYNHAKKTQEYIVRDNNTTFHTFYFDVNTGEALDGKTQQGYSHDSCWARGQAWGVYGFAISYAYTKDESFLITAKNLADYFLSKLPKDKVSYWDLIFSDDSQEERDSSASAILACGLLELSRQLNPNDKDAVRYEKLAKEILKSLSEKYTTISDKKSNGLLLHGVYDKQGNIGVDECVIWGDYFYLEGLVRLSKNWNSYW